MRPGDVIFARRTSLISVIIRFVTRSKWSHVALYLGEGQVVDTDFSHQVRIHSLSDLEYWEAKRYLALKDWQMKAMVDFAVEQLNKPYDYRQIWGFTLESIFGIRNRLEHDGYFTCGKLLDFEFHAAGIDLVADMMDGDVTPSDIDKYAYQLHDVLDLTVA